MSGATAQDIPQRESNATTDREGLQATFELFTRMSDDLASSYRALEGQVAALTRELDRVNRQREIEIQSRERVSAKLSNLLDLLPGGVIVLDRWGEVSQANPAAAELLEVELVGRKWIDIIAQCFAPKRDDFHEISLKNGKRVSLSTRSLEAETGQLILLTDQTETRHLQAQLSRNQRLTALGNMVSALAHQIRTPLSAALLYASHIGEQELEPEKIRRFGQKIVSRLNQLEQQVSDMLVFARGDIRLKDTVNLEQLCDELQRSADVVEQANQVELVLDCRDGSAQVLCNRQVLLGALLNLVNNAAQASKPGQKVMASAAVINGEAVIDIADRGEGIEPEVLQRILSEEAFVTTKSQGTGLGLAVSYTLIRQHGGSILVEETSPTGSIFAIRLPVTTTEPA